MRRLSYAESAPQWDAPSAAFPACPESTIAKFIENKGAGVHHVAFAIEDGVANALAEAESKEIRLIDKAPRKGAEGLNIAFLHPKSTLGVLTELCEH